LYCILPNYQNSITIRDVQANADATLTVLGSKHQPTWKRKGKNIVVDLSSLKPGDINSSGIFVIKMTNTQQQ
jgi:hypothetical protein